MHSTYVQMTLERQRAERHKRSRHHYYRKALRSKVKNCCRKTIAFLFTQIGVCALVVGYTVLGAFAFMAIESQAKNRVVDDIVDTRSRYVNVLWNITSHWNVLHHDRWRNDVSRAIQEFQGHVVQGIRKGYDGSEPGYVGWTFPAALMYCLTVYTTIGYGNLTPRTVGGKLATIIYALIGIPLMLLYMSNVGDILASSFKYTYNKMCRCRRRNALEVASNPEASARAHSADADANDAVGSDAQGTKSKETGRAAQRKKQSGVESRSDVHPDDPETVSVTSCLVVMLLFVVGGAILFSAWEGWGYVDGSYFCFTSLLTIGFGDFVPGQTIYKSSASQLSINSSDSNEIDSKLILCAVYLLLGMALLAMCFNLMQEEVFMKIKRVGRRLGLLRKKFG